MAENDRLETLLGKMQEVLEETECDEAMHGDKDDWPDSLRQGWRYLRSNLRQAIAELPLIRDQYERKIAELEEIITNNEMGETT